MAVEDPKMEAPAEGTPEFAALVMLEVMDVIRTMEEAARGYKAELIEKGWSETAAEQIAVAWLITMQTKALSS